MKLSTDQHSALKEVMNFLIDPVEKEMALSGPSGSGKTTLVQHIIKEAKKQAPLLKLITGNNDELKVVLTSSTNKAAKVLMDATKYKAGTIHKLLGLRVYNDFSNGKTRLHKTKDTQVYANTLIILDEGSMISLELLKIIREQTLNCKILFVGDANQLAPVFETTAPVFSNVPKQVHLTTIQRQAAGNPIIQFGHAFVDYLNGKPFPDIVSMGTEIQWMTGQDFQDAIDVEFKSMTKDNDVRALAWTNKRVHQLNSYIRHTTGHNQDYVVNERVLTNQPVMSGNHTILNTDDIAQITGISTSTQFDINGWNITLNGQVTVFQAFNQHEVTAAMKVAKKAKDWPTYFALKEDFADLRPIFACTVAKSQGSTYKTVFLDLDDIGKCRQNTDIARMMYVASTRPSEKLIMTGNLPSRLYK